MAFVEMAKRITGVVPGVPLDLAKTYINQALGKIYDEMDWSFQKAYGGFLAPGQIFNVGRYTVTPFSNQIIANQVATDALANYAQLPLITQMQYRDPSRAIYNIIAYDTTTNAPFATLTLDRPWLEATTGPNQPYMIYQCYFVAPVEDFRKFVEIRDTTNAGFIDFWSLSQSDLGVFDPQRTYFSDPQYCVPAGVDLRPNSATHGWQMFELWPQQLSRTPYSFSYRRRGYNLKAPTDKVPYPLTEELVEWRTKEMLYQFKEAQKDKSEARGSGANWMLLSQMAQKEYSAVLDKILSVDVNLNGDLLNHINRGQWSTNQSAYANRLGGLNVGGYPERY